MKFSRILSFFVALLFCPIGIAQAQDEPAFKIDGKVTTIGTIYKEDQAAFYDLEKKKYELIDRLAREKYLGWFWQKKAKESGKSIAEAQKDYEKKNLKVSNKEVKETLDRYKDHPSLKKLSAKEQDKQIREFLQQRSRGELQNEIIDEGIKKGELVISYPEPEEPIYNVSVTADDHVRFGPDYDDTKPMGCKGDDCAITIVEYSEFQCPFCVKVLPDVKRVLSEYKGKVRWVVRDFPLSFHDRARPAAIAAHCAGQQGKYWNMYGILFDNQRKLGDDDLKKYAGKIGLNKGKFDKCVANSGPVEEVIDKNFRTGASLGVSGTPAFFINGRRLSGALPFSEFERVIKDELAKNKKS
jgi:protein-disulfide isomerase